MFSKVIPFLETELSHEFSHENYLAILEIVFGIFLQMIFRDRPVMKVQSLHSEFLIIVYECGRIIHSWNQNQQLLNSKTSRPPENFTIS